MSLVAAAIPLFRGLLTSDRGPHGRHLPHCRASYWYGAGPADCGGLCQAIHRWIFRAEAEVARGTVRQEGLW